MKGRELYFLCSILAFLFSAGAGKIAWAHSYNESYVYFDVTETTLDGRIEMTLRDLARVLSGAAEERPPLTEAEVLPQQDTFFSYFAEKLTIVSGGERYPVAFKDVSFLPTSVGIFAKFHFSIQNLEATPITIDVFYDAVFNDIDPLHRGFALIGSNTRNGMAENEAYISLVFAPGDSAKQLYLNDQPTDELIKTFVERGFLHIWFGSHHMLFLIAVLLSSVMRVRDGAWEPAESLMISLRGVGLIAIVFTLVHTVTLSVATFSEIALPQMLIDAMILSALLVAALRNFYPVRQVGTWKVVFVCSLFQGFAFANALDALGPDPAREALGIAAFVIGSELAHLAIMIALFPLFFGLRRFMIYRTAALQGGSIALIAVAMFLFAQRTMGGFA
ncbi:MAG: HupE/UreJ family protein [Pseudomonadota bacterium]